MWDKIKAFGLWLYNWMTVLGTLIIGSLTAILPYVDMFAALDWASVLPPETAAKVMFVIAATKAICVGVQKLYEWATA